MGKKVEQENLPSVVMLSYQTRKISHAGHPRTG
jgi:hypothetical protein